MDPAELKAELRNLERWMGDRFRLLEREVQDLHVGFKGYRGELRAILKSLEERVDALAREVEALKGGSASQERKEG